MPVLGSIGRFLPLLDGQHAGTLNHQLEQCCWHNTGTLDKLHESNETLQTILFLLDKFSTANMGFIRTLLLLEICLIPESTSGAFVASLDHRRVFQFPVPPLQCFAFRCFRDTLRAPAWSRVQVPGAAALLVLAH